MKNFWHKLELPAFIRDRRLTIAVYVTIALSLLSTVVGLIINPFFGLAMVLIFILSIGFLVYGIYILAGNANNFASSLSYRIKRGEQEAMIQMPLGIMLYDQAHMVQWVNPYLQLYFSGSGLLGHSIESIDRELSESILAAIEADDAENRIVRWGSHYFELFVQDSIGVVYLFDISRYAKIEQRYQDERLAIGQIFIDNYDELSEVLHDQELSTMSSFIQKTLNDYCTKYNAYLKRIDEEHFLLLSHVSDLLQMEEDKFSVIDQVRTQMSRNNTPLTLSIGVGYGANTISEIANLAQSNLDLALGRGGDQVVLRQPGEKARYFGGKSNPMEKRTRVRARIVAQALLEIIKESDQVFVVGHQRPDMDAVGGAIGVVKIARLAGVDAHVVLNEQDNNYDITRLINRLKVENPDEDLFISPTNAQEKKTDRSLLVMVDHSKYSITYDAELYASMKERLVVIDHHRRGEEFPENPMLTYVEPYASSTCELVTEMVEYLQPGQSKRLLTELEATAMLAGIVVDSKEFSLRTGTRTFDAASYLRSIGADTAVITSLEKEGIDRFLERTNLVASLEMFGGRMAIMTGPNEKMIDPVITAQAADSALSLDNVEASFAITRRSATAIGISARSMGKINVQLIMEKLGGGGHLSNAATQLQGVTVTQAKAQLTDAIDEYLQENE